MIQYPEGYSKGMGCLEGVDLSFFGLHIEMAGLIEIDLISIDRLFPENLQSLIDY